MLRSPSRHSTALATIALGSAAAFVGPVSAAELFVAGTIGEVYVGDSETGGFQPLGAACLGPIQALAMDDVYIYAGDAIGGVSQFDLATGNLVSVFFVPDSVTAMVMHDGDLLISEVSGAIHRVDPMIGVVESTLLGPFGIEAMLLVGDDLFVSSALEGIVWKGDPVSGNFEYFGCGCSGAAQGLAHDDSSLYAGDAFGQYVRYDLSTGSLLDEGFLPFGISAMERDGEVLLLSESNGTIHRMNPVTWEELGTLISPIAVEAMLLAGVSCPWDLDNTGDVGINDLLVLLAAWGPVPTPDPPDFDGDGTVGITDFLELLAHWGACP